MSLSWATSGSKVRRYLVRNHVGSLEKVLSLLLSQIPCYLPVCIRPGCLVMFTLALSNMILCYSISCICMYSSLWILSFPNAQRPRSSSCLDPPLCFFFDLMVHTNPLQRPRAPYLQYSQEPISVPQPLSKR